MKVRIYTETFDFEKREFFKEFDSLESAATALDELLENSDNDEFFKNKETVAVTDNGRAFVYTGDNIWFDYPILDKDNKIVLKEFIDSPGFYDKRTVIRLTNISIGNQIYLYRIYIETFDYTAHEIKLDETISGGLKEAETRFNEIVRGYII